MSTPLVPSHDAARTAGTQQDVTVSRKPPENRDPDTVRQRLEASPRTRISRAGFNPVDRASGKKADTVSREAHELWTSAAGSPPPEFRRGAMKRMSESLSPELEPLAKKMKTETGESASGTAATVSTDSMVRSVAQKSRRLAKLPEYQQVMAELDKLGQAKASSEAAKSASPTPAASKPSAATASTPAAWQRASADTPRAAPLAKTTSRQSLPETSTTSAAAPPMRAAQSLPGTPVTAQATKPLSEKEMVAAADKLVRQLPKLISRAEELQTTISEGITAGNSNLLASSQWAKMNKELSEIRLMLGGPVINQILASNPPSGSPLEQLKTELQVLKQTYQMAAVDKQACIDARTAYDKAETAYHTTANDWSKYESTLSKLTPEEFATQKAEIDTKRAEFKTKLDTQRQAVQTAKTKLTSIIDRYPDQTNVSEKVGARFNEQRAFIQGFKPPPLKEREIALAGETSTTATQGGLSKQFMSVLDEMINSERTFLADASTIKVKASLLLKSNISAEDRRLVLDLISLCEKTEKLKPALDKLAADEERVNQGPGTPEDKKNQIAQLRVAYFASDSFKQLQALQKEGGILQELFTKSNLHKTTGYDPNTQSPVKYYQRVGKYPLLWREAQKALKEEHPLFPSVQTRFSTAGEATTAMNEAIGELQQKKAGAKPDIKGVFERLDRLARASPPDKTAIGEALTEFRMLRAQHRYAQIEYPPRVALLESAQKGQLSPEIVRIYNTKNNAEEVITSKMNQLQGELKSAENNPTVDKPALQREIRLCKKALGQGLTDEEKKAETEDNAYAQAETARLRQELQPFPVDEKAVQALYARLNQ